MDRFIEWLSCSFILCSVSLKSNMDRFIVSQVEFIHILICYLKSNMDRFIESELSVRHHKKSYLKSNMDRFIVVFVILHNLINII